VVHKFHIEDSLLEAVGRRVRPATITEEDLVVFLPGIGGSVLVEPGSPAARGADSTDPPDACHHRFALEPTLNMSHCEPRTIPTGRTIGRATEG
jgi:hypothetical protein